LTENQVSIIIPTFNESENICNVLKSIKEHLPKINLEAIVVDDNSPDGTGKIVEEYVKSMKDIAGYTISVIHRKAKEGLSSAVLDGLKNSNGDTVVVMDSDLSHPPHIIPKMLETLKTNSMRYCCSIKTCQRWCNSRMAI